MRKGKIILYFFLTLLLLSSCFRETEETISDTEATTESSSTKNAVSETSEASETPNTPEAVFANSSDSLTSTPILPSSTPILPSITFTPVASPLPTSSLANSPVPPTSTRFPKPTFTIHPTPQTPSHTPTVATGLELESPDVLHDKVVLMWNYLGEIGTPDNNSWYALEVWREGDYVDQVVNKYWLNYGIYEIISISAGNYSWRVIVYEGNLQESRIEGVLMERFGTLHIPSDINSPQSQPTQPTIAPTPTNIPYP